MPHIDAGYKFYFHHGIAYNGANVHAVAQCQSSAGDLIHAFYHFHFAVFIVLLQGLATFGNV